jgi:hypothetical protein
MGTQHLLFEEIGYVVVDSEGSSHIMMSIIFGM